MKLCGVSLFVFLSYVPFLHQVSEFLSRFDSIPTLLELDHLTVSGDVTFGKNVELKVCDHFCGGTMTRITVPSTCM